MKLHTDIKLFRQIISTASKQLKIKPVFVEKEMTKELKELDVPEVTSKGSRFRKSVFEYESIDAKNHGNKVRIKFVIILL